MANFFKDYQAQLKAQRTEAERIEAERIAAKEAEEHIANASFINNTRTRWLDKTADTLSKMRDMLEDLIEAEETVGDNDTKYLSELKQAYDAVNTAFDHVENAEYMVEA
jgi:hypothetical protein